ncbi:kinesin-like protein KIN-7E [Tanacetum coccineum]
MGRGLHHSHPLILFMANTELTRGDGIILLKMQRGNIDKNDPTVQFFALYGSNKKGRRGMVSSVGSIHKNCSSREFIGKDKSTKLTARLNSVDLARSESAALHYLLGKDSKKVSTSTVFSNLFSIHFGLHHVNYRDSKLTQVTTNAQVDVVMFDKALVKHLQKEMAGLENELRMPAPPDYSALLKKKDQQIDKVLGLALALQK